MLWILPLLVIAACDRQGSDITSSSIESLQATVIDGDVSDQSEPSKAPTTSITNKTANKGKYRQIEWIDLMPEEDIKALSNPPSYIDDIEDGSLEDQISSQMKNAFDAATDDSYQKALASTSVLPEFDGLPVRIPGFVVPLEFDDDQTITQFFLVPFFGACIHVPPPPPNQIIFVNYPKGFQLSALYDPFWISGVMETTLVENDMAVAAYSLQMEEIEPYSDY